MRNKKNKKENKNKRFTKKKKMYGGQDPQDPQYVIGLLKGDIVMYEGNL